mgnify:CR=1 FL=1
MEKVKILAIVGSLRKDSLNRQLALAAKEAVGGRADFSLLSYDDVPLMNQDIEYPAPEAVSRVRGEVRSTTTFSPEYLKTLLTGCRAQ